MVFCVKDFRHSDFYIMLEKTLESPLDCKEIQPVHSKGDQSWVFFGRNDAKAETPVLWPPHGKSWLIGKDSDARTDWGQEEKGTTQDEMAGWHHGLDGCESEWTPGVGDGQGGLACCNSWGHKESDTTERLNWLTEDPLSILFLLYNLIMYNSDSSMLLLWNYFTVLWYSYTFRGVWNFLAKIYWVLIMYHFLVKSIIFITFLILIRIFLFYKLETSCW